MTRNVSRYICGVSCRTLTRRLCIQLHLLYKENRERCMAIGKDATSCGNSAQSRNSVALLHRNIRLTWQVDHFEHFTDEYDREIEQFIVWINCRSCSVRLPEKGEQHQQEMARLTRSCQKVMQRPEANGRVCTSGDECIGPKQAAPPDASSCMTSDLAEACSSAAVPNSEHQHSPTHQDFTRQ